MAGERWTEFKAYLAALPIDSLYAAADAWEPVSTCLENASTSFTSAKDAFGSRGIAVSAAARELEETGEAAYRCLDSAYRNIRSSGSVDSCLSNLATYVRQLRDRVAADEKGGAFGFGALPDATSAPVTMAQSIIRDALLTEFDERAEVYRAQLQDQVNTTVSDIRALAAPKWPDGPTADPDGPRPTG